MLVIYHVKYCNDTSSLFFNLDLVPQMKMVLMKWGQTFRYVFDAVDSDC